MKKSLILIFVLFFIAPVMSQQTYFNEGYPYNGFSTAKAVEEYQNQFYFWGVTHDNLNNNESVYLACVNDSGNITFWKTISHPMNEYWGGYATGLRTVDTTGFIAAGHINYPYIRSNAMLFRFDLNGDTLWTCQYPDTITNMRTQFWNCNTTSKNGFIGIGYHTVEAYNTDVLIVKTDSIGTEIWRKEYGVASDNMEQGFSIEQTSDGEYFVGYYHYVAGHDDTGDPIVMKVDSLGNFLWEVNLGGPYRDFYTQVCMGNDGSYIAGTSISDSTSGDNRYSRIKIYKISPEGEVLWNKYYCQTELYNSLYAIYPDHDSGYIATGMRYNLTHPGNWNRTFGWLLKVDENGDSVWYREYEYFTNSTFNYNDLYDLCLSPDKGYVLAGQAYTFSDPQRAWLVKVDSIGCDTPGCGSVGVIEYPSSLVPRTPYLYIFPNPTKEDITIRYRIPGPGYRVLIYDLFGRKQDEMIISPGQEQTRIDVSAYPPGVYMAVLKSGDGVVARGKFVKH